MAKDNDDDFGTVDETPAGDLLVADGADDETETVEYDPTNPDHDEAETDFKLACDYADNYPNGDDGTGPEGCAYPIVAFDFQTSDGYVPNGGIDYNGPDADDEKSSDDEKSPVAKVSAVEKRANVVTAVESRDIDATVSAMVAHGKGASELVGTLVATALVACQTGDDTDTWDMVGMRDLSRFKSAVEAAFAAADTKSGREPSDPTTGAVMAFVRAMVNREKANRTVTETINAAEKVGVSAANLSARTVAFLNQHGIDIDDYNDLVIADNEALDKVYAAARGGRRVASTDSDRVPAPNTPQNGADGWATGKNADHIREAALSGCTTLKEINKAVTASYPTKRSTGAIRNAFMRGVEGFVMANAGDRSWSIAKAVADAPVTDEALVAESATAPVA